MSVDIYSILFTNGFNSYKTIATLYQLIFSSIPNLKGLKILDICCGEGNWTRFYNELIENPGNIFGIDIDKDRILKARLLNPAITYNICDAEKVTLNADIITMNVSSMCLKSKKRVIDNIYRILNPQGKFIWVDVNTEIELNLVKKFNLTGNVDFQIPNCTLKHKGLICQKT